MNLTDSHCHLASHQFSHQELQDIVQRAQENHVQRMITLATNLNDIPQNIALCEQFENVYCALGIHPCDVHEAPDHYWDELKQFAKHPKCVAIGETGLDYFHSAPDGWTDETYRQRQRDFLKQHFSLASELGKNIVIHTRDKAGKQSLDDAVAIYRPFAKSVKAVFHCFLGPLENAQDILALGGYLSYTGISTFKKATATLEAAAHTPADRIMVETDSPYLSPEPNRGKRCEPAYTYYTAKRIADARKLTLEKFASITEDNVNTFFQLSV